MSHEKTLNNKIYSLESLLASRESWAQNQETVVFTNGCFDILHRGHIDYLNKAADLGTKLIVAINSDNSVKTLDKGLARPIQDEQSRAIIIAALECVDAVVIFEDSTPLSLIQKILPDTLVKGGDYIIENIVGHKEVVANGGNVRTIDFLEGFSTSSIENKIKGT